MVHIWIPDDCLRSDRASEPFALLVQDWSEEWFGTPHWQTRGNWQRLPAHELSKYQALERLKGLKIKGKSEAVRSLALAILSRDARESATTQDAELLRQFGQAALHDLKERLEKLTLKRPQTQTEHHPSETKAQALQILIGEPDSCPLALEIAEHDLASMVRGTFLKSPLSASLSTRDEARNDVTVNVAACLGTATVNLRELAELAVGDLLILGTRSNDPATLLIEDIPTPLAFSVVETSEECVLQLQEIE